MGAIYTFNGHRAGKVYRQLVDAYLSKDLVFSKNKMFLPDEKIPKHIEKGSAEHALYLFTIAPLTKREVSNEILNRFRWYCEDHPEFLTIDNIFSISEKELVEIFKSKIKSGFYQERAHALLHNCMVLAEKYERDARNIFGGKRVRKSIKNLQNDFREYALKTSSMLALWFHKYNLADITDPQNLLPAIDIHKIRISRMTGAIDFELGKRIRDSLVPDFAEKLSEFCKRTKRTKNPLEIRTLDEALWILGSELCTKMDTSQCLQHCPVDDLCSKEFIVENHKTCRFERVSMYNQDQTFFEFLSES